MRRQNSSWVSKFILNLETCSWFPEATRMLFWEGGDERRNEKREDLVLLMNCRDFWGWEKRNTNTFFLIFLHSFLASEKEGSKKKKNFEKRHGLIRVEEFFFVSVFPQLSLDFLCYLSSYARKEKRQVSQELNKELTKHRRGRNIPNFCHCHVSFRAHALETGFFFCCVQKKSYACAQKSQDIRSITFALKKGSLFFSEWLDFDKENTVKYSDFPIAIF